MSRAGTRHLLVNHCVQGFALAVCALLVTVLITLIMTPWLGLDGRVPVTVISLSIAAVLVLKSWPAHWQILPRMHSAVDHLAAIVVGTYLRSMLSAVLAMATDVDCAATKTGGTLGCRILSHL